MNKFFRIITKDKKKLKNSRISKEENLKLKIFMKELLDLILMNL